MRGKQPLAVETALRQLRGKDDRPLLILRDVPEDQDGKLSKLIDKSFSMDSPLYGETPSALLSLAKKKKSGK